MQEQSTENHSLAFKLRADLQYHRQQGRTGKWVVRDPVSLQFFLFSDFEMQLARKFDGQQTVEEIHRKWVQQQPITWLLQFIEKLQRCSLLAPWATQSGQAIAPRLTKSKTKGTLLLRLLNPLSFRLPMLDPNEALKRMTPIADVLFSKSLIVLLCLVGAVASFSVLRELLLSPVSLSPMAWLASISIERLLAIYMAFLGVKLGHELGHALACRKWRVECHEVGILFFAFTPCFYCDTSDSWKLDRPEQRACIAAGGLYFELMFATLAAFVWLATNPQSFLHTLAFDVMLVCTIGTLFVNANPLLKYDGYYILADLARTPNLSHQSTSLLRARVLTFFSTTSFLELHSAYSVGLSATRRFLLQLYAALALMYRVAILAVILIVVWKIFQSFGLPLLGATIVLLGVANFLLGWLQEATRFIMVLRNTGKTRKTRLSLFLLLLIAFGLLAILVPIPQFVQARILCDFADLNPIYAKHAGRLNVEAIDGEFVNEGATIASIESLALNLRQLETEAELAILEEQERQLRIRLVDDPAAALELAGLVLQIDQLQAQLSLIHDDVNELQMSASRDGTLFSAFGARPNEVILSHKEPENQAVPYLSREFSGRYVDRGTLIGWLPARKLQVKAYVSQLQAQDLAPGMPLLGRWDSEPEKKFYGTVVRVIPEPLDSPPQVLRGDADFESNFNITQNFEQTPPIYAVLIELETELPSNMHRHALGVCHISVTSRSILQRLRRNLHWRNL